MSCCVSNNVYFVYDCHTSNNRNAIKCTFLFNRYSIYERLKCPPPSHSSAASLIRCGCWHVIQRCNQSTWPTNLCFVHFRGGRLYIIDFTLYNIMSCLQNRRLVIQSRFYHVCFYSYCRGFFCRNEVLISGTLSDFCQSSWAKGTRSPHWPKSSQQWPMASCHSRGQIRFKKS